MFIYIIYSEQADKFYVGITENLQQRLTKHKSHAYSGSFTKIVNDWEYHLTYKCENTERAKYLESFIKRMKSRKFIEKIIKNPGILKEL